MSYPIDRVKECKGYKRLDKTPSEKYIIIFMICSLIVFMTEIVSFFYIKIPWYIGFVEGYIPPESVRVIEGGFNELIIANVLIFSLFVNVVVMLFFQAKYVKKIIDFIKEVD